MMISLIITIAGLAAGATQHHHSFVATGSADLIMSGGASVTRNPLECLRSGSPNQHSVAAFVLPLASGVTANPDPDPNANPDPNPDPDF